MLESIPYSVVVIAAVALSTACVLAALLRRFGRIVPERGAAPLLVLAVAAVLYGGTKPGSGTNAPPLLSGMFAPRGGSVTAFTDAQLAAGFALAEALTDETHDFAPTPGAVIHEPWRRRGAHEDFISLPATNWSFPWGTATVSRVTVLSSGEIGFDGWYSVSNRFQRTGEDTVSLSIGSTPGDSVFGGVILASPALRFGAVSEWREIHRCTGGDHSACLICGHYPVTSVCATNIFLSIPAAGGLHLPDEGQNPTTNFVYHYQVENSDFSIRDYAVILHPVPGDSDTDASDMNGSWTKLSGPDSGTISTTNGIDMVLRKPEVGGIYSFRYDESLSIGSGSVVSSVILPLGGPDVTAYLVSEMQRYSTWASDIKTRIASKANTTDFAKGSILLGASDTDIRQALEARNLSVLQSPAAKKGWPSSETASGPTYPVFGLKPANE